MTTRCYSCNAVIEGYKTGYTLHKSQLEFIDQKGVVFTTSTRVHVICNDCGHMIVSHATRFPNLKES